MIRFFALSRTTHGILDIATPGFAALLWAGAFPPWQTLLLALFTAFAAYTAIYTLNDLVGIAVDREKFAGGINPGYSVEASQMRYPLAQGLLSNRNGWLWFGAWFIAALAGSALLNPVIVLILVAAAILEVIYCLLLKVTYWRVLVSGLVKASGPLAAVFVVEPNPAPTHLLLLIAWVFFWEIGGQNIPADWNDTVEDRRVNAKTIPLRFGPQRAGQIIMITLGLTVISSLLLAAVSPARLGLPYMLASTAAGVLLLIAPGTRLVRCLEGSCAGRLFDHASYYPLSLLAIVAILLLI